MFHKNKRKMGDFYQASHLTYETKRNSPIAHHINVWIFPMKDF